jgi:hypothetical protein
MIISLAGKAGWFQFSETGYRGPAGHTPAGRGQDLPERIIIHINRLGSKSKGRLAARFGAGAAPLGPGLYLFAVS